MIGGLMMRILNRPIPPEGGLLQNLNQSVLHRLVQQFRTDAATLYSSG